MVPICQQAIKLKAEDGLIYQYLGYALQMQENPQAAIRAYWRTHQCNSDLFPYQKFYHLGVFFYKKGFIEEAIACYEKTIAIQGSHRRINMGWLLQQNDDRSGFTEYLDLALLGFQKALKEDTAFLSTYDRWANSILAPDLETLSRLQFLQQLGTEPHSSNVYQYISNWVSAKSLDPKESEFAIASSSVRFPNGLYLQTQQWYLDYREKGKFYQELSPKRSVRLHSAKTIARLANITLTL